MYPHFIEVHDEGEPLSININSIAIIIDNSVMVENPLRWQPVDETYEQLKELIESSGCLINTGDPRLDNKPLTIDDLRNMIGEPVWSPNAKCWCLVYDDCSDDPKNLKLLNRHGLIIGVTEEGLIKFPMYRMKVTDES